MAIKKEKTKKEYELNSESVLDSLKKVFNALTSRYILISKPGRNSVKLSAILLVIVVIIAPWTIPILLISVVVLFALGYSFIIEKKTK